MLLLECGRIRWIAMEKCWNGAVGFSVCQERLAAALPGFLGEIFQIPPAYSAVKIDGRPAYQLARKGVEVQKEARRVHIFGIQLLCQTGENRFLLEINCSKGTYIRTLLEDIAKSMGEIAHTSFCCAQHLALLRSTGLIQWMR